MTAQVNDSGFRRTDGTEHQSKSADEDQVPQGMHTYHAEGASDMTPTSFTMLEPLQQLRTMLAQAIDGRTFSELSSVTFDHRAAAIIGHILLDTLEDHGYSIDDFDALGALTTAAVPLVDAAIHAAASRGQDLDGFVMDFVYPSIKGPSIAGKQVILVDSWLSGKSYIQTSSLVTLRNGNELSLDFSVVEHEGAEVVALLSLVTGLSESGKGNEGTVDIINTLDNKRTSLPCIGVFNESEFM